MKRSSLQRSPARSRFQQTLRAAYQSRTDARLTTYCDQDAGDTEQDMLQAWDPAAAFQTTSTAEAWRLQLTATDREGHLHRAEKEALKGASLANTPREMGEAAELLTLIEHELGRHESEMVWAGRLSALHPHDARAMAILRAVAVRHSHRFTQLEG